jgi:hypothetical protein
MGDLAAAPAGSRHAKELQKTIRVVGGLPSFHAQNAARIPLVTNTYGQD